MSLKIKNKLNRMKDPQLLAETEPVVNALNGNPPVIPFEHYPPFVVPPPVLKQTHTLYRDTFHQGLTGNHLAVAEKNRLREDYLDKFVEITDFVGLAAKKDPDILIKTGLHLLLGSKTGSRVVASRDFQIFQSEEKGVVIGKLPSVSGAKSYEVQINEGDPRIESNWKHFAIFAGCSRMEMRNLQPGTSYYFRVRSILSSGKGPWSNEVYFMVT